MSHLRVWCCAGLLALPVTAHAGTLTFTPPTRAFGDVYVAAPPALNGIQITNNGTPTTITGFVLPGCNEFGVSAPPPPIVLGNGGSVNIQVSYDPTNRGADGCTITVMDDNGVTDTFTLTGTGIAPGLYVPSTTLQFADQPWNTGTPETKQVLIQNVGNAPIDSVNLSVNLATGTQFSFDRSGITFPIGVGGLAALAVTFDPTSVGAKNDQLVLALSNDLPSEFNPVVQLSGTGVLEQAGVGDGAGFAGWLSVRPSPTRGPVTIEYAIPAGGDVVLEACDLSGRVVARTQAREAASQVRTTTWRRGVEWAPATGLYFIRLSVDGVRLAVRRVVVLK